MFPVHVTWNSKFKTFPTFQRLIVGHLLQARCGYLTDDNVVHKFQTQGESYFESTEFQDRYGIPLVQARYDMEYLFGILLCACRNQVNRLVLKCESNKCRNGMLLWDEIVTNYAYNGSAEVTAGNLTNKLRVTPVNDAILKSLFTYVDDYEIDLLTLQVLQGSDFQRSTWKSCFLRRFDCLTDRRYAFATQTCRDDPTMDVLESISYIRSVLLYWEDVGESHS